MSLKLGIDVGGTFTDAVLIEDNEVLNSGKVPTDKENLLETIITAMDMLDISHRKVDEITISTTLVTNAILQNRLPDVKLILFPGSGMKLTSLEWPVDYKVLKGELDFRGREVTPPDLEEFNKLSEELKKTSKPLVAICGKFSHRNNIHEEQLKVFLKEKLPEAAIALGSQLGQTNFYRRSLTTYLNLANRKLFLEFASQLKKAVDVRHCQAPIRVLKADGGVLPLDRIRPVESIYSGPAASILGALAQSKPEDSYVVVDVGGTTTDIGLVLSGSPLISSKGAKIGSFLTNVRSLAVRSVPIGGDSAVLLEDGRLTLAHYRLGPAYCLGGSIPTPTDAMRYLNLIDYGSYPKAEESLAGLLPESTRGPEDIKVLAERILLMMVDRIGQAIEELHQEWKDEPAYKVWEVLHHHEDFEFYIQLSGGGAPGISQALQDRMKLKTTLTNFSGVSNAIGAAMAKSTFSWTLNLDTYLGRYSIEETGEQGRWTGSKKPHREVEKFLTDLAHKQASGMAIDSSSLQKDPFDYFPLVESYHTVGQIVRGSIHVPPGVTSILERGSKI